MFNKILISSAIFLLSIGVRADELTINPDHPGKYTVVKGDTLWDISGRFLEQPWRWPEIWNVNPQLADPHLIYPGDIVSLIYQDGQPILSVERGKGRNIKLSPTIRSSDNVEAVMMIPIDAIQQFLERHLVFNDNVLEKRPYVVSSYEEHLIAATGNKIYVRGISDEVNTRHYSIYRKGKPYINPKENEDDEDEILGYEAIYVGDALLEKTGDPASALVTVVDREVLVGDRLLPHSDEDISTTEFIPRTPDTEVEGNVLSVIDGISQVGQYQVVVLNLGEEQGVEPGNVLGIYQKGYVVQDRIGPNKPAKTKREKQDERAESLANATSDIGATATRLGHAIGDGIDYLHESFPSIVNKQDKTEPITLPEEYVGALMIFRTFSKVSYALIMETQGPVHVLDIVRNL